VTAPEQKLEGMTPLQVEQRLRFYNAELDKAIENVRVARHAELLALQNKNDAHEDAMLSDDCPVVARNAFTVAYRDAWVAKRIRIQARALEGAKVNRQSAVEYLNTVKEQVSIFQSINKGVDTAYRSFR
jgi:hypothetical protein